MAVTPLHERSAKVARSDAWLYEMLSLVDAVRVGDARTRGVAAGLLRERLA